LPIFGNYDWGSSIFAPPGAARHPPHKCGGQGFSYTCKQQFIVAKTISGGGVSLPDFYRNITQIRVFVKLF